MKCEYAFTYIGDDHYYPCQFGKNHFGEHADGYGNKHFSEIERWEIYSPIQQENRIEELENRVAELEAEIERFKDK